MKTVLITGVIFMNLALVFYTYAVFSGRKSGLHLRHLVAFGVGLLMDYLGTHQMSIYAAGMGPAPEVHNLSGIVSLSGMGFHFLLALLARIAGWGEAANRIFHRVSISIYCLWCIAFASGAIAGMTRL